MNTMAKAKEKQSNDKQYEAMFLFGAAAASDAEKAIQTARGIIERHEGKVLVAKKWDERKLAYEIRGQKRGLYVITYFTAPGNAVAVIERDVNLSEDVLRVMVTDAAHLNKDEMEKVEPQPIIKEERPSWERGGDRFDRGDRPDRGDRDRGDRVERRDRDDRGGAEGESRPPRPPRRAPAAAGNTGEEKPAAEPIPSSRE
jgi:small subunit ribosomal protein S6